jgi:hypothetical protein
LNATFDLSTSPAWFAIPLPSYVFMVLFFSDSTISPGYSQQKSGERQRGQKKSQGAKLPGFSPLITQAKL